MVLETQKSPLVSVVIPTYNRELVLPRTLDSVLRQSYANLEIIIVDDGGVDGTAAMLKEFYPDPRITYVRLECNQGVHMARNRGLDLAKGEYVILLDSDDEIYTNAVSDALAIFLENPDVGLVAAPFSINGTTELTGLDYTHACRVPFEVLLCSTHSRPQKNSFVMLRRSAIGQNRFVMQNLDFIFYRHVGKNTRMYYLPNPLGIYRLEHDKGSLSVLRKKPDIEKSIKRARVLDDFLKEFGQNLLRHCPRNYATYAYGASVGLLLDGKTNQSKFYARKAAVSFPRWRYRLFFIFTLIPGANMALHTLFRLKGFLQKIAQTIYAS